MPRDLRFLLSRECELQRLPRRLLRRAALSRAGPAVPRAAARRCVRAVAHRWPACFSLVSVAHQLLLTATDAQNPLAVGGHARLDDAIARTISSATSSPNTRRRSSSPAPRAVCSMICTTPRWIPSATVSSWRSMIRTSSSASWMSGARSCGRASKRASSRPSCSPRLRGPVSVNPVGVYDGLLGIGQLRHPLAAGALGLRAISVNSSGRNRVGACCRCCWSAVA